MVKTYDPLTDKTDVYGKRMRDDYLSKSIDPFSFRDNATNQGLWTPEDTKDYDTDPASGQDPLTHIRDVLYSKKDENGKENTRMWHERSGIRDENGKNDIVNHGTATSSGITNAQMNSVDLEGKTIWHSRATDQRRSNGGTFFFGDMLQWGRGEKAQEVISPEGTYRAEFSDSSDIQGFWGELSSRRSEITSAINIERENTVKHAAAKNMSKSEAARDSNNRQLSVWHEYVSEIAGKHGIDYKFIPDNEMLNGKNKKVFIADPRMVGK